ncbi:leukocyte immunoglobulin-like receptor subfamily B member 5 isoform X2 [Numida meleagris]|uniref:leukocyte immunoglobulin-like receptor subfamily B member 5 isoform X2 n=1 Tax=Numida meleagris TaxID=8996 RepID=UPI000B3D89B9|nr:leukocyte immunoglobulin-like receptor subfamily B member 5 isoform X2 [Numida meleagris]
MAPVARALTLGWSLVAVIRAQHLPRPSLWLHPSQGVSVGDNVTLRCHLPWPVAWVWLYQEGGWTYSKSKDKQQDAAEFSFISTSREHAGTYRCQYREPESAKISEQSDPVQLVVTGEGTGDSGWLWGLPAGPCPSAVPSAHADHSFPPPDISLRPEERVGTGTNVTFHCWNKGFEATFLLHKDGCSAPVQHQVSSWGGAANFTVFGVAPADAGTYRCSYRPWHYPHLSSPLGDSVMLEVTPTPAPPGAKELSRANLVIALVRGLVAALVFGLGVFFVIDARSLWR